MKNEETFLDYNYSKDHHIILSKNKESSVLFYTEDAELSLIAYIQKKYDDSFVLSKLEFSDFNKKLSDIFTENSSNSSDLVQGVDESIDLDTLASDLPKTEDLLDDSNEAPVIKLINAVLAEAIKDGASDIHIEPYEEYLSIRFRVDGILKEKLKPSSRVSSLLNARIKIMSNLDIAERRVPQDGRMSLKLGEKWVDIRVSTLPSSYGERIVLRLLDKAEASLDLKELGMNDQIMQNYLDQLKNTSGIILVTGPTGSGKTTTLYSGLSYLNDNTRNILTVEDPIEYALNGIGQTQVNQKVGMSFSKGLRAILRQDPDVVMVGEIRDKETAETAIQASLTGHLVLSTVHTNDAVGAITRLYDMGVEPYLLASTLKLVIAQRLVRKLDEKNEFSGRTGIYESLVVDDEIKNLIHENKSENEIKKISNKKFDSIYQDGLKKVEKGITSEVELKRVLKESE
ncbi:MAG: type II secretion system protein GspE [Gammaproteobacteria bacterium]|jgi:general secretion pathway protein E|nr:type II secretion system protein GspE [Gammaproteobacteria bacterium]|tara:strand:- start:2857 stop:4227 length:1371 start_codon:yes stop_codon:yes gene_type:complete